MNIYNQITTNKVKTYFFIAIFIGFMSLIFYIIGQYYGDPSTFLLLGMIISLISGVSSYFYSDKIVLAMTRAKPATKEQYFDLYTVTENMAISAGLPMPRVYVIEDDAPNAFATGRDPKHAVVAATTGLLQKLDRAELEGVISHEISHVKNYDMLIMTVVAVLAGTIAYTVDFFLRTYHLGRDSRNKNTSAIFIVIFMIFIILMPFIAQLIKMAISRKREYLADASGALLTRNPKALASALEKIAADPNQLRNSSTATAHLFISNPLKRKNFLTNISNFFSTHPPVEDRVRILKSM